MKTAKFFSCILAAWACFASFTSYAQVNLTESGNPVDDSPRDGVYETQIATRQHLVYRPVQERDVLWEKRIWREIDIKELRNHHFANANRFFVDILLDAAIKGDIQAYSVMDDQFKTKLTKEETYSLRYSVDTTCVINPETFVEDCIPISNELNPEEVTRFRIKEVWYFDNASSRLNVRILGIAPIVNRLDDNGNFLHSAPMCWFYFDELRPILAKEAMFNPNNDRQHMSWDDVFVSRYFGSYITKESNTRDLRLQDKYSGVDVLRESDKIKQSIQNFEHDLYSY